MDAVSPTLVNLIIFVLAIYVGYHVVWTVTPALHTPLMAVTTFLAAVRMSESEDIRISHLVGSDSGCFQPAKMIQCRCFQS